MQTEKIASFIVNWLKNYVQNARMRGCIVGISGGIDSAVVSTLAAKTGLPTLVLDMPIRQKQDQLSRSREQAVFLQGNFKNVDYLKVDLTSTFEAFEKTVLKNENDNLTNLSLANTRARLRMTTLYYYGQLHQLLVTGTGNKVEDFGVGFFTKYGDGGVDISPIGDLMKTEVFELAKFFNVPQSIQNATPTDGLWDTERTDEQQMGATYVELEWAMKTAATGKTEGFVGRRKEVLDIYNRLHHATLHKINPIPVCKIPDELK